MVRPHIGSLRVWDGGGMMDVEYPHRIHISSDFGIDAHLMLEMILKDGI